MSSRNRWTFSPARTDVLFDSDGFPRSHPLLPELDGLLAGLNCDLFEQEAEYGEEEIEYLSISGAVQSPTKKSWQLPNEMQWKSIRELRQRSKLLYHRFHDLTSSRFASRALYYNRSLFHSAREMLDTGIATHREILFGNDPTTLKETFAYTCLSYLMSKILQRRGKMSGCNVLADTGLWRMAIENNKLRQDYDELVREMWPDTMFPSHKSPATSSAISDSASQPSSPAQFFDSSTRLGDLFHGMSDDPHGFQRNTQSIFMETNSDATLHFETFMRLQNFPDDHWANGCQPEIWRDTGPETEHPSPASTIYENESPLETVNPLDTVSGLQLVNAAVSPEIHLQERELSPMSFVLSQLPPFAQLLAETLMFQTVVEFIRNIQVFGDILYQLSGCGITTRRSRYTGGDIRPRNEFGRFVGGVFSHIFSPLRQSTCRNDHLHLAVLSMTEGFVISGHLQTVREIEEYVISVSRYLARSYESYTTLVFQILQQCLDVFDSCLDHAYYGFSESGGEYSSEYIQKRREEEARWAKNYFHPQSDVEHAVCESEPTSEESLNLSNSNREPRDHSRSVRSSRRPALSHSATSSRRAKISYRFAVLCTVSDCRKTFGSNKSQEDAQSNLCRHKRTVHELSVPLKCPDCKQQSKRRDNLRNHFKKRHPESDMPDWLARKSRG